MRKRSTIRDVAREAGVSVAVVSRVLNDGTGPVAPQTRARVVEAIERLGYQPRAAARELQQQSRPRSASCWPIWRTRSSHGSPTASSGRRGHAASTSCCSPTRRTRTSRRSRIETLVGRSVGSVIATPTGGNVDKWRRLIDLGVNVVFVDREIDELPGVDVVAINNDLSAEAATQHLLDLGHERIAFISGPLSTSTGRDRVAGFRKAMAAAGVEVDERLIHAIPFRGDSGGDAVSALLALPNPPTGMIVGNTAQVRSALRRVKQSAIAVPDDLSLIVFDDNPWTELVSPPLIGHPATDRHARPALGRTRRRPDQRRAHRAAPAHQGECRVRPALEHRPAVTCHGRLEPVRDRVGRPTRPDTPARSAWLIVRGQSRPFGAGGSARSASLIVRAQPRPSEPEWSRTISLVDRAGATRPLGAQVPARSASLIVRAQRRPSGAGMVPHDQPR